ncbi:AsmA family protein [Acidisoma silvae]|uniref:AsmA family protein n=1 Tax=Acidisoma silvae TaxID=2802396 RepID=A0A963YNX3_9PROT|nr:AsmA family protein [Acidisoma silvae]MCB8874346.1 AsmA family protein [Acidisoma silvae]
MSVRRAFIGVVTVLVVGSIGAGAFFLSRIDPNDYKPEIQAVVLKATGRALTLDGPLSVSLSLWPVITAEKVQLANLPGGSRSYMVRVNQFRAQLSLPALLWHRLEILNLSLTGPNILFEEVDHQPNWLFKAAQPAGASNMPAAATPPVKSSGGFSLRIRAVHIVNGMITFRLPAKTTVVGVKALDYSHSQDGGPVSIASTLVYSDFAPFTVAVHGTPTGGVSAPWKTRLDFAAFGATAKAAGTASLDGSFDATVQGQAPKLEALNALLPALGLPALHGLVFSTHVTNGPVRGDLPIIGQSSVRFGSADFTSVIPGLQFGAVSLAVDHAGGTAQVKAAGQYQTEPFTLAANLGMPADPNAANRLALHLTAQAFAQNRADLKLDGTLALTSLRFAGLDAATVLHMPALAKLRALVSPAVPDLTNITFSGNIALPAALTQIGLTKATLATSSGTLAGSATIGIGLPVRAQAQLQAQQLDVDALIKAFGLTSDSAAKPAPAAAASNGPLISDTALPWPLLRGPDIDLRAEVDRLTFLHQAWDHLSLGLRVKDGRLTLDPLRLGASPALATVTLNADATPAIPAVQFRLSAPALPLAFLTGRLGLPGPAAGNLALNTVVTAQGKSLHAMAGTLTGSLSARMGASSISNATLKLLAQASLDALHITVPAQGQTAIRCFALDGSFTKGIANFKTIALDSTYLQMAGDGQVNMGAETMALKLHPMARIVGSSVAVPVIVDGPWRTAKGTLQASVLDKVGLLLDGLFGGDTAKGCAAPPGSS